MLSNLFQFLDMRSFPSIWYWATLSVVWSMATHRVLGAPFDVIQRARRHGGEAEDELLLTARLGVGRLARFWREAGVAMTAVGMGTLSGLVMLGFGYRFEFAQALVFLVAPLMLVGAMNLRAALRLEPAFGPDATVEPVLSALLRHRFKVQLVGVGSILVTVLWGMTQILRHHIPVF